MAVGEWWWLFTTWALTCTAEVFNDAQQEVDREALVVLGQDIYLAPELTCHTMPKLLSLSPAAVGSGEQSAAGA
jgi:hypothetical protein